MRCSMWPVCAATNGAAASLHPQEHAAQIPAACVAHEACALRMPCSRWQGACGALAQARPAGTALEHAQRLAAGCALHTPRSSAAACDTCGAGPGHALQRWLTCAVPSATPMHALSALRKHMVQWRACLEHALQEVADVRRDGRGRAGRQAQDQARGRARAAPQPGQQQRRVRRLARHAHARHQPGQRAAGA